MISWWEHFSYQVWYEYLSIQDSIILQITFTAIYTNVAAIKTVNQHNIYFDLISKSGQSLFSYKETISTDRQSEVSQVVCWSIFLRNINRLDQNCVISNSLAMEITVLQ